MLQAMDLPSRFGIQWGICEMREEVSGLGVWTTARLMANAGEDKFVVSDALRST
jgi:hypothetical protein